MSLRMVAGDTPRSCRSARALLPTGSLVETKSWTIALRTCSRRSSCATWTPPRNRSPPLRPECRKLALIGAECQPSIRPEGLPVAFLGLRRSRTREARPTAAAVRVGSTRGRPRRAEESSPDLQSGARGPSVSRPRHDHAGLGADPPAAGPDGHAGHHQARTGARRAAGRRLHVLRRPVPARRAVEGRALPRGRPAPGAAGGAAAAQRDPRAGARPRRAHAGGPAGRRADHRVAPRAAAGPRTPPTGPLEPRATGPRLVW